jgi:hypothetical protein
MVEERFEQQAADDDASTPWTTEVEMSPFSSANAFERRTPEPDHLPYVSHNSAIYSNIYHL